MRQRRRSGDIPEREKYRERNDTEADTLTLLRAYVYIGLHQPSNVPKEIERVVAAAFDRYLNGRGSVSLDEAFGLTGRQRAGHPIARQLRSERYVRAMLEVARLQVVDGLNIEQAVAKVAAGPTLKEEVLLKDYKRHGVGKSLRTAVRESPTPEDNILGKHSRAKSTR